MRPHIAAKQEHYKHDLKHLPNDFLMIIINNKIITKHITPRVKKANIIKKIKNKYLWSNFTITVRAGGNNSG